MASPLEPSAQLEAAAAALDEGSETLLAERALQQRYDRKYMLDARRAAELVRDVGDGFQVIPGLPHRLARYDTVYLDSAGLVAYHDHRRGKPRRMKARVRTYVDRALSVLELKQRTGRGTTVKHRLERSTLGPLSDTEKEWLLGFGVRLDGPPLRTRFARLTLLGAETPERVTIDTPLRFSEGSQDLTLAGLAVVEVKTGTPGQRSPVVRWLRDHGLRSTSFSKYCVGRALLQPDLPRHAFSGALRRAAKLEAHAT
ncbi:MAG: polyphosphate polymerase domain-containing protein [Proteobacteria bacterium]|nr:polyphosphate polymerase domain-containing protein [Pseudomonadota bacterium]